MSEVTIDGEEIPDELKERDQWLMWDASADAPRRPHWRGDFAVSWTDPADWHSFEEAIEAAQERETWGIGYVFANTNDDHPRGLYGALDLDGCVSENGSPKDWLPSLQPFFDAGAYMERSPSGEGIHIPLVGFEPPEWWRDSHFTDEEHEGVEAYGKKFFTFTGDRLRNAGDDVAEHGEFVENWLIETYKSITGDDPTKEKTPDFDDVSDGGRANREEFLDEDDVRDALDHISPDVDYNTWRDIGFALADFFSSDHTALSVFEDWSRGGSKWDSNAENQAERIISDASSGGGRTIGTVVHHARQAGWEMPTSKVEHRRPPGGSRASAQEDTGDESGGDDAPSSISWDYVRNVYTDEGKNWGRYYAADALDDRYSWMYVVESETLWVYDEERGYFNRWGEQFAANVLERELGTNYSRNEKEEVIDRLQARHQTHREELNAATRDGYHVCVGNGVVDLETGGLHEHDPSYKFTRGLRWDYEPAKANPDPVVEFLDDITKREEDRETLLDHLAHGLMPGHPFRAFVITYGPGSNGKTQMGQLFRGFVGEDNAASVELQDLTGDDQFATGGLPGAFVNVGDDISVSEIRDVSILKSLTGGGTVRANEKYEKQYEFKNEAAMFFSANEPPRISEESDAIGDRLYPIEMPYRFLDGDQYDPDNPKHKRKKPGISKQLLDDEAAMRGLLLLAVKHAQELLDSDGQYSMPEGPQQRRAMYEAASDPIRRFALDYMEAGPQDAVVLKDDAYDVYKSMCEKEDERVASADGFKRQIAQQALVDVEGGYTRKYPPGDDRDACWRYVRFSEDAKNIMPPRLVERYFDDESVDDEASAETDRSGEMPLSPEHVSTDHMQKNGRLPTIEATVTGKHLDRYDNPAGHLAGDTGGIDYTLVGGLAADELPAGATVRVVNAKLTKTELGALEVEIDPTTEVVVVETPDTDSDDDATAATDGGAEAAQDAEEDENGVGDDTDTETDEGPPEDAQGRRADAQRLAKTLKAEGISNADSALTPASVAPKADDMGPSTVKRALQYGTKKMSPPLFARDGDSYYLLDTWG